MPLTHTERRERREAIAEFCRKRTVSDACKKWDVSEGLVQSACREYDVVPRTTMLPDRRRLRLVAALVNTKRPFADLGRDHGISRQAVEKFSRKCLAAGLRVKDRAAS